jgi:pantetheine-phosphate adenylyltransferase
MKFRKVAAGGTFDHFHDGHLALLRKAFEVGERVYLGVCSDEMVQSKGCHVQPLGQRLGRLLEAVFTEFGEERAEVVVIRDPYGPAVSDPELEAIVVSPETRVRAEEINRIRRERGLRELQILEIPFVLAEDGKPISSTRIRRGEIDPRGRLIKGG